MSVFTIFGIGALVVLACMIVLWIISLLLKDSSIVDIFWGLGFVILAVTYFILTDGFFARKVLITALAAIWGLRLSIHIFLRNKGKGEDYRYQEMRANSGPKWWWWSFFQVFMFQGVLMLIISTPLLAAQFSPTPARLTVLDGLGAVVWVIGFIFEAGGDWQLARFKRDPENKGKVLRTGLWAYTRHPNYFGDATQWWGYFLIALAARGGFWTIFSPILMTVLLLRVSGVALLERSLAETKPQYRDYIESTSAFFPLPPRKRSQG
jgi:steroid 5-alpha reductase family enzyme